ncbi:MAG TPA: archease [Thermoplasmata archaeon]|nr:archease [Thermoplasmata archaeon]
MKRFEELDHTADVGIRAYGKTLDELFANAAAGMFSLITDLAAVRPVGEYEVKISAKDAKALLFDFLSELVFLHDTQKLLFCEFDVTVAGLAVDARARGERIDRTRHPLHLNVKAVTYHAMEVDPERGVAQVIFDI